MGVWYELVNVTKHERVGFAHLGTVKAQELAGNPASAAVVTWYLLHNRGDEIGFVSDDSNDWPFSSGSQREALSWPDMTEQVVNELLHEKILSDNGFRWQDQDDLELYVRDLQNCFFDYATHPSSALVDQK